MTVIPPDTQIYSSYYFVRDGKPVIKLCGRSTDGFKKCFLVDDFKPYCYFKNPGGQYKGLYGGNYAKVEFNLPKDVRDARQEYPNTAEADVLFHERYFIDSGFKFPAVKPHTLYLDFEEDRKVGKVISLAYSLDNRREWVYGEEPIIEQLPQLLNAADALCAWGLDIYDAPVIERLLGLGDGSKKRTWLRKRFVCFDLMPLFKTAWRSGGLLNYRLDTVAKAVLGEGKVELNIDMRDIGSLSKEKLKEYNEGDVDRLERIDKKLNLTDIYVRMAALLGAPIDTTFRKSTIGDFILVKKAREQGLVLPNRAHGEGTYVGAYRYIQPGLYRNVINFDISEAYPAVCMLRNISPENPSEGTVGFLPKAIREFIDLKHGADKKSGDYKVFKESANALIGMLGYPRSRIFNPQLAEQVTSGVHNFIKSFVGHDKLVYLDTDGLFFKDIITDHDLVEIRELINVKKASHKLDFHLTEDEYESLYAIKKTHYIARTRDGAIIERGVPGRRGDSPALLKELHHYVVVGMLDGVKRSVLKQYVQNRLDRIHEADLMSLVIPKSIKKDKYETDIQQKRAADYSEQWFGTKLDLRFDKVLILYIKSVPRGYPLIDVIHYPGYLPDGFIINYNRHKEAIWRRLKPFFEVDEKDLGDWY